MTTTESYSQILYNKLAPTLAYEGTSYAEKSKKCLAHLFITSVSIFEIGAVSSARVASVPYHTLKGRGFVVMNDQVQSAVGIFSSITGYNENTLSRDNIHKTLREIREKTLTFADSHKVEIGIAMFAGAVALSLYIVSPETSSTNTEYLNQAYSQRASTSSTAFQPHQNGNNFNYSFLDAVSNNPGTSLVVTALFTSSFAFFLSALYLHRNLTIHTGTSHNSSPTTSSRPLQADASTTSGSSIETEEKAVSSGASGSDVNAKKTRDVSFKSTVVPNQRKSSLVGRIAATVACRGRGLFQREQSEEWLKKTSPSKNSVLGLFDQLTDQQDQAKQIEQSQDQQLKVDDPPRVRQTPPQRSLRENRFKLNTQEYDAIQQLRMFEPEFVQQPLDQSVTSDIAPPPLPSSLSPSSTTTTGTTLSSSTNQVERKKKKRKHRVKKSKQPASRNVMQATIKGVSQKDILAIIQKEFPDDKQQEEALQQLNKLLQSKGSFSGNQASTTSPKKSAPPAPNPPPISTFSKNPSTTLAHTSKFDTIRRTKDVLKKVPQEELEKSKKEKEKEKMETLLLAKVYSGVLERRPSMEYDSDSEEGEDWEK